MEVWIARVVLVALAVVAGWLVPAGVMRLLMPTLITDAPRVRNYRGKQVVLGLGLVWLPWAVAVTTLSVLLSELMRRGIIVMEGATGTRAWGLAFAGVGLDGRQLFGAMPVALVLAAFALGLVDDVFGGHGDKGFRGHLGALVVGRLTTGGLKLFGIGLVAALAAWGGTVFSAHMLRPALWGMPHDFPGDRVLAWFLLTVVIAATANLVNLTDLRPGRALKAYGLLVLPVLVTVGFIGAGWGSGVDAPGANVAFAASAVLAAAALLLGPVLAVWRLDLTERGMLGDAGANAFGVLAGYMLASVLPLAGLAVAAVVLVALNLASERVSFSAVIERTGWLRALDRLGRPRDVDGAGTEEATAG